MTKTFSTKLDSKILLSLEDFCKKHNLKKSHFLAELIHEGLERRAQTFELAKSIQKGLEEEKRGEFYTADEVENLVLRKKKAS
ncbi:MAG: hypothetical protein HY351_05335 [Candidatus Omnitrophica bacterium]|nr:hypothetical protein [Candidatus Omnitrophota bacterium]